MYVPAFIISKEPKKTATKPMASWMPVTYCKRTAVSSRPSTSTAAYQQQNENHLAEVFMIVEINGGNLRSCGKRLDVGRLAPKEIHEREWTDLHFLAERLQSREIQRHVPQRLRRQVHPHLPLVGGERPFLALRVGSAAQRIRRLQRLNAATLRYQQYL